MIAVRRLMFSLILLGGCAQETNSPSDATSSARPELAQVTSAGMRDWISVGGTASSGPAICSWTDGRFDVFVRGADNAVWHRAWDQNAWSNWESLGGTIISDPAAVSWGPGRIDLFARGRDNGLYRKVFDNGSWSKDWEKLGGTLASSPAVTSWGPGRLDVFARGPDGALYQKTFETGWTDWVRRGGAFNMTSDPAVTSWDVGRIDVVARGTTGDFHHVSLADGKWGSWASLGSNATSVKQPPQSWLSAILGLRIPRSAEELWLRWVLELANNANPDLTSAPALASWGPGRLDLFATSQDGTLYHRSFSEGGWGEPISLGSGITSAPDAVSWGEGQIDLVARGTGNAVVYRYFDGSW
jgi:hypothetical protein